MASEYLDRVYRCHDDTVIIVARLNKIHTMANRYMAEKGKLSSLSPAMTHARAIYDYIETAERYDAAVFAARFLKA